MASQSHRLGMCSKVEYYYDQNSKNSYVGNWSSGFAKSSQMHMPERPAWRVLVRILAISQ